jgi:hypothetical protein
MGRRLNVYENREEGGYIDKRESDRKLEKNTRSITLLYSLPTKY